MRKMKTVLAWTAIRPDGTFEPRDDFPNLPFLYVTKRQAKVILPSDWRLARVEIREVRKK